MNYKEAAAKLNEFNEWFSKLTKPRTVRISDIGKVSVIGDQFYITVLEEANKISIEQLETLISKIARRNRIVGTETQGVNEIKINHSAYLSKEERIMPTNFGPEKDGIITEELFNEYHSLNKPNIEKFINNLKKYQL